jgi:hypothetical protein
MVGVVLLAAGLISFVDALLRGYGAARSALQPLAREGDPTRTLIETTRPIHARMRVRVAARHAALSLGWIVIAMYGLFLATAGAELLR